MSLRECAKGRAEGKDGARRRSGTREEAKNHVRMGGLEPPVDRGAGPLRQAGEMQAHG